VFCDKVIITLPPDKRHSLVASFTDMMVKIGNMIMIQWDVVIRLGYWNDRWRKFTSEHATL